MKEKNLILNHYQIFKITKLFRIKLTIKYFFYNYKSIYKYKLYLII